MDLASDIIYLGSLNARRFQNYCYYLDKNEIYLNQSHIYQALLGAGFGLSEPVAGSELSFKMINEYMTILKKLTGGAQISDKHVMLLRTASFIRTPV